MEIKFFKIYILGLFVYLFFPFCAKAMEIQSFTNLPVTGDFVVGPAKVEILVNPGENAVRNLQITNRTGQMMNIFIDIEDFTGDETAGTALLGNETGPFSLKNYLFPEPRTFKLSHGERGIIPVNINIPENAEPGGLYGSVIVRAEPDVPTLEEEEGKTKGQVVISSRIAALFFVRVAGNVFEDGILKSFSADKKFYQKGPISFTLLYENKGSVHLNPYASIEITNLMGKKVDEIDIAPWFVMPGFSRSKVLNWEKRIAFGRYTATAKVNRGYQDIIDEQKINFWVIPLKHLAIGASVIIFFALIITFIGSKFEIKRK